MPLWKTNRAYIAAKDHKEEQGIYAVVYIVEAENSTLITQDVTDNTGDFAANMTLSENRAKSVMKELIFSR